MVKYLYRSKLVCTFLIKTFFFLFIKKNGIGGIKKIKEYFFQKLIVFKKAVQLSEKLKITWSTGSTDLY